MNPLVSFLQIVKAEKHEGAKMDAKHDKSLGELVGDLSREAGDLVRKEIQLAKTELSEKAGALIKGAALLIVAGVLAFFAVGVLLAALIFGLVAALNWPEWMAALAVGIVMLLVAGVLAVIGIPSLKKGANPVPQQTVETLKEDAQWAKEQVK